MPFDPEKLYAMAQGPSALKPNPGFEAPSPRDVEALLPEFEVSELIGRGGMGAVYKARQKHLDRIVALKILPAEIARDPAFAERFEREARTLARLNHPNVVRLFDFGNANGIHYLVMEHIDGTNLRQLLEMGRPDPKEALRIVPQICEALEYAHGQGVVHRDIKPENILVDGAGNVHLADFGIARIVGQGESGISLTASNQRLGTPHYMAPEQVEAPGRVDHRADLFAVGVVFYEMLTGRLPLGRFDPPSKASSVGVRVDDIVFRSLDREPERRYQEAKAMKDDVVAAWKEGFVAGAEVRATKGPHHQPGPPPPLSQSRRDPTRPTADARFCWQGLIGLVWFLASIVGVLMCLVAVEVSPMEENTVPEDQTLPRLLSNAVLAFSAAGLIGGPILGIIAEKRIRHSRGRLYGLRPAIIVAWAPVLLIFDIIVFGATKNIVSSSAQILGPILQASAIVLNIFFIAWQVRISRRAAREIAAEPAIDS